MILNNIEIKNMSRDYKGVVTLDGKKCFIDDVITGDVVDIEVYKETSKYYLAKPIIFLKRSINRVDCKCKYSSKCGGCDLEYVCENYYYNLKINILYDGIIKNFQYFVKRDLNVFKVGYGKRRRISLNYKDGIFGFFKKNSNEIVQIDKCINVDSDINLIIEKLSGLKLYSLSSVDITKVENGIVLNFNFIHEFDIKIFRKLNFLKQYVIMISYCVNDGNPIRYFYRKEPLLKLGSRYVSIPEKCFLQATKDSQDFMIKVVCESLDKSKKVADLYCGIGTYSFPLSEKTKVYSFEGDDLMVNSVNKNIFKTQITVFKRDLFKQPLICNELDEFDGIVINPPRNGAENQCKFIAKSKIERVVYISCNLDAFLRDTRLFVDRYKLVSLYLIDQFFMSKHFEIIGVFEKIRRS